MGPSSLFSGYSLIQDILNWLGAKGTLLEPLVCACGACIKSSMLLSFLTFVWLSWTTQWWWLSLTRKIFGNSTELMPGFSLLMMLIYPSPSISGPSLSISFTDGLDMRRIKGISLEKNQSISSFMMIAFGLNSVVGTWHWLQNWLIGILYLLRTAGQILQMGKHSITSKKKWKMQLVLKKTIILSSKKALIVLNINLKIVCVSFHWIILNKLNIT